MPDTHSKQLESDFIRTLQHYVHKIRSKGEQITIKVKIKNNKNENQDKYLPTNCHLHQG